MLKQAKPLVVKLGLDEPPRAAFVIAYGDSISKIRRAERAFHLDCSSMSKTMGVNIQSMIIWEAGRVGRQQTLRVRVVDNNGKPINDATVTAAFPPETRDLFKNDTPLFQEQNDGSWLCGNLPDDEEFTLTVAAKGYQPSSQKLKVRLGEMKNVEVKLSKKQ